MDDLVPFVLQFSVGSKIIAEEGVSALYRGLSAGLLRQATYTTARLGIYQYISDVLAKRHDGKVPVADHSRAMQPSAACSYSLTQSWLQGPSCNARAHSYAKSLLQLSIP